MPTSALLIDLEGIDGAGKGTQARLLRDRLLAQGRRAEVIGFPRYGETLFGRAVGEYLDGSYGELDQVHPFLVALLFAGDRLESRPLLLQTLAENDVVILDRYVASNVAHQASKRAGPERDLLTQRILQVEYQIHALPAPNLVILLDLPVPVAQQLVAQKAPRGYTQRTADIQEADACYLQEVRTVYLELAHRQPGWFTVNCCANGLLRQPREIAEEVWNIVAGMLPRALA